MQGRGYCFFPLKKSGSRQASVDDGFMNIEEEGREEVFFSSGRICSRSYAQSVHIISLVRIQSHGRRVWKCHLFSGWLLT